jgi:hypothetical protein
VKAEDRRDNLPFKWDGEVIILDEAISGRLYEAYFGFVPDGNGYRATKYTYPLN